MPSRFAQIFLAVAGLVFAGTGATFLFAPLLAPSLATHTAPTADAINDVRAIYGGMEIAYGVFLGLCATRPRLYEAGYLAAILLGAIAGASRFLGFALDGSTPVAHLGYGVLDLVGAAIAVVGLRRLPRED